MLYATAADQAARARPFPFTRIAGQEEMKQALILNVVDPNIGGVLIMGDRGTGKSVAVRCSTFECKLPAGSTRLPSSRSGNAMRKLRLGLLLSLRHRRESSRWLVVPNPFHNSLAFISPASLRTDIIVIIVQ